MKNVLLITCLLLLASPALAQEIDLGLGGDVGGLLNLPAPTGRGTPPPGARGAAPPAGARGTPPRGAAPARGAAPNAAPVDRLVTLRQLLASANAPLSPQQETGLNALLNTEIPAMKQALQARILELQRARSGAGLLPATAATAAPPPPPTATAPTLPGAPSGAAVLPSMDELAPEIIRLNDQLLGKIADAPLLEPPQQTLIRKLYKDQVKSRGGFDAIKLTMEEAGAPFSGEQIAQIQPLFDQQNEARAQLVRENQGQAPDKTKLDQLQRDTLAKVLKLLTAPQRTALLTPAPKAP